MSSADFRMIRPIAVTDAKLSSSTVPEEVVTEYSPSATYVIGDVRGVTAGTAQDVYQSLQAANTGNAPASAPLWWKFLGRVYAVYSAATTYAKGDIVTDLANHQLYESLDAPNTNNALSIKTKWLPRGTTNRWKMFDKGVHTQTTAPDSLSVTIATGEVVNTVTLLNVTSASVTITQSVSGYSRTKSLIRHDVLTWYDFFYEEPIRTGDVVFDDIPPFPGSSLTITVNNLGDDAALGCCFIGKARILGKTKWGLTGGILSYSSTKTDPYGDITIVKGTNARRLNVEVYIPTGFESEAYRLLSEYTDVEMVFIATSDYSMAITYGFLGPWHVPISNSGQAAPIEIRGLV
jgi:hypothetical protein